MSSFSSRKQNVTPWDIHGTAQPALVELVENEANEKLLPRTGKALVPGCGKGYDVVYFARTLGLDATGVEISETAREAAKKFVSCSSLIPRPS